MSNRVAAKMDEAKLTIVRTAVWESWGELCSLELQEGDVAGAEDVRLYNAHVKALKLAVDTLMPEKP